jgi:FKBP-type peptidyl-prolyl cis-trans isomerase 2
MAIKKKDFVELEYTAKLKEEDIIFDTTDEALAKKENIHSEKMEYGPIIICVGEQHVIKGLDSKIEGKEPGTYTFEIPAEEAFGKKNPQLIQLISTAKFRQQKITPMPGLQINIDGTIGTVKTVTGGRTMVDFNHPLSGKDVVYEIKITRIVTDKTEKAKALLKTLIQVKDADIKVENDEAKIKLKQELPKEITEKISEKVKDLAGFKKVDISKE